MGFVGVVGVGARPSKAIEKVGAVQSNQGGIQFPLTVIFIVQLSSPLTTSHTILPGWSALPGRPLVRLCCLEGWEFVGERGEYRLHSRRGRACNR